MSTQQTPVVSITVQGYKNPEMLKLCIDAVVREVTVPYELIVADSATQEDTALMMREDYPEIVFLPHKENVGFGAMVNACLAQARGEYIMIMNADTIVTAGAIEELVAFCKQHNDAGMIGPLQKNFNYNVENTRFRFYKYATIFYRRTILKRLPHGKKHLAWFNMEDVSIDAPHKADWIMGSAMLITRAAYEKTGGMDPRFFMYMEDVDWCRRIWDNGYTVWYNPRAVVHHFYGKGSGERSLFKLLTNKLVWIHIASACKYFLKYAHKPRPQYAQVDTIDKKDKKL